MIPAIFDYIDAIPDWQFALILGVLALVAIGWAKWIDKAAEDWGRTL